MKARCLKCFDEHAHQSCNKTYTLNEQGKIAIPKCNNCGKEGHLASWRGCCKIPQIISGNFFSHAMGHRTEQVPQREVLIKTPPKGAGFESGALGLLFSGRDEKGQLSRA
ncbi:hypothetical protein AVEN_132515-1 [Araneus ventricosus]|uniref:Uncharacterized protein n=1 Tax=Araneus ventricosus TaxID=182803 RepID=A0A4Y2S126_ARAVE|nr:hypothetical protein AVEN_132515-1 [Araneus ventricosus]